MPDFPRRPSHLASAFALLITALTLCACKPDAAPAAFARPPAAVTVATAVTREVPVYLDEIGKTVASELVTIQPQVTGQIMARHFVDGAELKIGDPLFTIDTRNYEAKVAEAVANLDQSLALLELAQADFARTEKAFKLNVASREDFDNKKGVLDTASAHVKVSQAAVDTSKLTLSFCTINSPIQGRAGSRLVDVGNIVTANATNILVIQRISPIYADFTITERDLPTVRTQMAKGELKTLINLPQTPDVTHSATLTFLDSAVQDAAGRIRLRVTLPNTDRYFWPGQFVNVRLVLSTQSNAVLLPYGCTQMGQKGPYVYVVKPDNTVEQRAITVGQRQGGDDDLVVILSGVKSGESVVRTGQLSVGPGGAVHILETPPVPAAPPPAPAVSSQPSSQPSAGAAH